MGTLQAGPGGGSAETGARGDHDILLARIGVATLGEPARGGPHQPSRGPQSAAGWDSQG